jgi:hypothetical protein
MTTSPSLSSYSNAAPSGAHRHLRLLREVLQMTIPQACALYRFAQGAEQALMHTTACPIGRWEDFELGFAPIPPQVLAQLESLYAWRCSRIDYYQKRIETYRRGVPDIAAPVANTRLILLRYAGIVDYWCQTPSGTAQSELTYFAWNSAIDALVKDDSGFCTMLFDPVDYRKWLIGPDTPFRRGQWALSRAMALGIVHCKV